MRQQLLTDPIEEDLPDLFFLLKTQGTDSATGRQALNAIEYILQGKNMLPVPPERPSERAMRANRARRNNGQ